MKRCPSCQRTFPDDAPNFCPNDGQRLVNEESATFDPEKTVMASGGNLDESPKATARPSEPQQPPPTAPPNIQPPPPPPPHTQNEPPPQQQQWQPQGRSQFQQQGWPPPPAPQHQPAQPPPQAATPAWGAPFQQPAQSGPYNAPFAPSPSGSSRALAIAALTTGACAATIMLLSVMRSLSFTYKTMLALSVIGLGLGVTSLILSLQKPSRFGGIPLAIAGIATGTAALVYYFMR